MGQLKRSQDWLFRMADELVSGIRRKNDLSEQRTNGSVEKVARLAL